MEDLIDAIPSPLRWPVSVSMVDEATFGMISISRPVTRTKLQRSRSALSCDNDAAVQPHASMPQSLCDPKAPPLADITDQHQAN